MKQVYFILMLAMALSGCATKYAYLNTSKTADELRQDRDSCTAGVDASDLKDADLKQKRLNQCMQDKGYNVVSEEEAEKTQGLKELWIKPGTDFKAYEAIFIDSVDLSRVKVEDKHIPDVKVTPEDIDNLGKEMLARFSKALNAVMPVMPEPPAGQGRKVLYLSLRLNKISQTALGANIALEVAGEFSPVPLPDAPEGDFSFTGVISDYASREQFITMSDGVQGDKNSSLVGTEKFSHWQKAYNVMDYWADKLAALLAKERGQEYKSKLRWKII